MCVLGEEGEETPVPNGERRGLVALVHRQSRLAISTGEGRVFANLLSTVGVS